MWYALLNDEQLGPMDTDELRSLFMQGVVGPETLIWSEGWPEWSALGETEFSAWVHEAYEDASDESIADEKTVVVDAQNEDLLAAFDKMMLDDGSSPPSDGAQESGALDSDSSSSLSESEPDQVKEDVEKPRPEVLDDDPKTVGMALAGLPPTGREISSPMSADVQLPATVPLAAYPQQPAGEPDQSDFQDLDEEQKRNLIASRPTVPTTDRAQTHVRAFSEPADDGQRDVPNGAADFDREMSRRESGDWSVSDSMVESQRDMIPSVQGVRPRPLGDIPTMSGPASPQTQKAAESMMPDVKDLPVAPKAAAIGDRITHLLDSDDEAKAGEAQPDEGAHFGSSQAKPILSATLVRRPTRSRWVRKLLVALGLLVLVGVVSWWGLREDGASKTKGALTDQGTENNSGSSSDGTRLAVGDGVPSGRDLGSAGSSDDAGVAESQTDVDRVRVEQGISPTDMALNTDVAKQRDGDKESKVQQVDTRKRSQTTAQTKKTSAPKQKKTVSAVVKRKIPQKKTTKTPVSKRKPKAKRRKKSQPKNGMFNTPTAKQSKLPLSLDRKSITRVLNKRSNVKRLKTCVQKDPSLKGRRVTAKLRVERSGKVSRSQVVGGQLKDSGRTCLEAQLKRYRFPKFRGEPMTISPPIFLN